MDDIAGGGLIPPIIVDIISRSAGFSKGVEDTKAQMGELSAAADDTALATDGAMADADASLDEHAAKVRSSAGDIAGDLGMVPLAAREAADDTARAAEDTSAATRDMAGDVEAHASKSGGAFKKMGAIVGDSLNSLGVPIASTKGKLSGVGDAAGEAEGGLSKFALGGAAAIAAVGVAAVDLGVHMDDADAKIATATGTSLDAATKIGNAFLGMGGKTEFSGTAMATAYAAVAGQLKATEGHTLSAAQAAKVMAAASNLAESTQTDLGDSTQALSGIMQTFGLKTAAAAHVSDVLYAASNATGVSVTALSGSLEKARSKLGPMSGSVGDLSSMLVDLAERGVTGRAAMSVLNGAMNTLSKTGAGVQIATQNQKAAYDQMSPSLKALADRYREGQITSKAFTTATQGLPANQASLATAFGSATTAVQTAQAKYREMGVTVFNSKGSFVGLASVIAQLHPKFADMTQQQQLAAATTLFGASAARQMVEVIKAGPAAYDNASKSVNKYGSAQSAARTEQHSLGGEFKVFMAYIEDVGTKLGEKLIPPLTSIAKTILPLVMDGVKAVGKVFADLGAAWKFLGPLHDAIIAVAVAFGIWELATIALDVVMDANPIVLIGLAIIGLIVAVVEIVKHFGIFKAVAEDVWHAIESVITGAVHAIAHVISSVFHAIVGTIEGVWHAIEHGVKAAWDWIKDHLSVILPIIIGIILGPIAVLVFELVKHWKAIEHDIVDVWHSIEHFFTHTLGNILGAVGRFVGGLVSAIFNAGEKVFSAAVHFGEKLAEGILHGIEKLPSLVLGVLSKIPIVGGLIKSAGSALHSVVSSVGSVLGLASGGVAVKPTIAMIGEGSEPEAVLPLSQLRQLLSGQSGDFYPAPSAATHVANQRNGLTVENLNIVGRSKSDAEIVNDVWLKLRPYLTAAPY